MQIIRAPGVQPNAFAAERVFGVPNTHFGFAPRSTVRRPRAPSPLSATTNTPPASHTPNDAARRSEPGGTSMATRSPTERPARTSMRAMSVASWASDFQETAPLRSVNAASSSLERDNNPLVIATNESVLGAVRADSSATGLGPSTFSSHVDAIAAIGSSSGTRCAAWGNR